MSESFVDLTYRGLSLGRRIKLAQVRPSSGFLELPSPMPVGAHVAIATEDGVAIDATVAWVHEQVTGTERTPGMIVMPELASAAAAAWWAAHVVLPDDEPGRGVALRGRSVTLRPRSHSKQMAVQAVPEGHSGPASAPVRPPAVIVDEDSRDATRGGVNAPALPGQRGRESPLLIDDEATIIADDLHARIAAAAGVAPRRAPSEADEPTVKSAAPQAERTLTEPLDPHGEHAVVDDGISTSVMASIDPGTLGIDEPAPNPAGPAEPDDADDADEAGQGDGEGSADDAPAASSNGEPRPRRKKRKSRR